MSGSGGKLLDLVHQRRLAVGADLVKANRKLDRAEAESLMHQIAADPSVEYVEVDKQGGSGKTDVHVLNGANGFQTFLLHSATVLHATGATNEWVFDLGDYNRDGIIDLYAIDKQGGSGKTDMHVLNGANGFQNFLLHRATALHPTGTDRSWELLIGVR